MRKRLLEKQIKLALPKGKLLPATACLLSEIGIDFDNYTAETRVYRLHSRTFPHLSAKMFHEKDVPVQVAVGNYDLGICGSDWIEELLAKYPASSIVKLSDLRYDKASLHFAVSTKQPYNSLDKLIAHRRSLRIVTEYPNLAESAALHFRLKRFRIFPAWGGAEVYPPEDADVAVLKAYDTGDLARQNLIALRPVLDTSAFLIANRDSLQSKNVSEVIGCFGEGIKRKRKLWMGVETVPAQTANTYDAGYSKSVVRMALPDGHQRSPAVEFLKKAGITIRGYTDGELDRRPVMKDRQTGVKVIRPQDMPLHVANGNFDLAVTGKDWLLDHLYRFPSSPVVKLLELGFGAVRVVVVVSRDLPVSSIADVKRLLERGTLTSLRVASEYIKIADRYLHENHMNPYKLIPTWGASEVFLPEDADMLIENTQTGKTLATHNLKIIDTILESTACLIANKNSLKSSTKAEKMNPIIDAFRRVVESE